MGSQGKQNPNEIAHASVKGIVQNLLTNATCDQHRPLPDDPAHCGDSRRKWPHGCGRQCLVTDFMQRPCAPSLAACLCAGASCVRRVVCAQLPGGHLQADGADDAQEHDLAERVEIIGAVRAVARQAQVRHEEAHLAARVHRPAWAAAAAHGAVIITWSSVPRRRPPCSLTRRRQQTVLRVRLVPSHVPHHAFRAPATTPQAPRRHLRRGVNLSFDHSYAICKTLVI